MIVEERVMQSMLMVGLPLKGGGLAVTRARG